MVNQKVQEFGTNECWIAMVNWCHQNLEPGYFELKQNGDTYSISTITERDDKLLRKAYLKYIKNDKKGRIARLAVLARRTKE